MTASANPQGMVMATESSVNRTWYIYCHTSPSGKRYIGQTCMHNPKRRWDKGYKGCTYFEHAIQKYGWDKFEHSILAVCHTKQMADLLEQHLIARFNTTNPNNGYNILKGGRGRAGHAVSEETKRKISQSLTGRKGHRVNAETRQRMSEAQKAVYREGRRARLKDYPKEKQDSVRKALYENAMANRHSVVQFDKDGNKIAEYPSIAEASRQTNTHKSNITVCCQGKTHTAHGFIWRYRSQPETFPNSVNGLSS